MDLEEVLHAIDAFKDHPLTENQHHLLNYLHANVFEVVDAFPVKEETILTYTRE
jgi:hypothetical protein